MSRRNQRRKKRVSVFSRRSLPGSAPGTLVVDPDAPKPVIRVMAYGPDRLFEDTIEDVQLIRPLLAEWPVTWINVAGLGDLGVIRQLGEIFGIHRLALEDVINVHQRPKVEQYQSYCYIVSRGAHDVSAHRSEQVSIFLGRNFVLSFQEKADRRFDPVIERIREGEGASRTAGPDHLAYAIIDAIIDGYFPVLERFGELLEFLEDAIVENPSRSAMEQIHELRRGLLALRRAAWPMRESLGMLYRDPNPLIDDEERLYLRDSYDHTVQIIDLLENYRDVASGLMEMYLSSISNRTNEIMKVLTIISSIFIPLTLISGIYGMNFDAGASPWNMPELKWRFGYPFALGLMGAVALASWCIFRAKGWVGAEKPTVLRPGSGGETEGDERAPR